jgi:Na+/H+ antiporter NhaC
LEAISSPEKPQQKIKWIQTSAWLSGVIVFVESSISVLTVGTLFRPLFDRMKISREKLAYIADSSSAPTCILIPLNAWGAFIMGLLLTQGFNDPFQMMISSIPYNFYPIISLFLVPIVIWMGIDLKEMKKAEHRVKSTGKLLNEGATPMISEELTETQAIEDEPHRAINMILPLAVMVLCMPIMLAYTGWETALAERPEASFIDTALFAIGQGSGSASVLTSVTISILVAIVMYKVQGLMRIRNMMDLSLKGISGMLPLALLMLLAFAISTVCKELNTGEYVAYLAEQWLSPNLVPLIVFLVSCFIAFSTGTSWGTFAIMIAIAMPMAEQMNVSPIITLAAALGGGIFGDHCSPISDTTILSSMAAATDHIDHVRTQIPYAMIAGTTAALIYLAIGFIA